MHAAAGSYSSAARWSDAQRLLLISMPAALPAGLSYSLIVGMVASYRYATSVSIKGLGPGAQQCEVGGGRGARHMIELTWCTRAAA